MKSHKAAGQLGSLLRIINRWHIIILERDAHWPSSMIRQRLIDYHILRIRDGSKAARLDSIQQLILLEAVEALDALRVVVETDSDLEVRRAAQEAGRHLFRLSLQKSDNQQQL